jgi:hypothetical protein
MAAGGKASGSASKISLPRDALHRIDIGQSFAEYDPVLFKPGVFVKTPALEAALDPDRAKCFFVGRRGTGKTAITRYLDSQNKLAVQLYPRVFEPMASYDITPYRDTRQRPFRSLVFAFKRALICEAVATLLKTERLRVNSFPESLAEERSEILDLDFDVRFLTYLEQYQKALADRDEKAWLGLTPKADALARTVVDEFENLQVTFLIDRIDEAWDGSDHAVIYLMALMHACVELTASCKFVRPRLFLRENIFERVRRIDNEFARLETGVVSLEWTRPLLRELVERRLGLPFNTRPPLGGPTWDYFFESSVDQSSQEYVFEYCQDRPRDVLTYCGLAIESAQAQRHEKVTIEDLQAARTKFSESRLKDLGDEYAENYPQVQLVLNRFYGLGKRFTMPGIEMFIKKLLVDEEVKKFCGGWIYAHTAPEQFVQLLYGIGFIGIDDGGAAKFRSVGAQTSTPPPITNRITVSIHPSYVDALRLQDQIIGSLPDGVELRDSGIIVDLPDAIDLNAFNEKLQLILDDLASLPLGEPSAARFEDLVGEIIKFCFFKSLANVEPKVRNSTGRVIRDWIAANRAQYGFWEMVRQRYGATQVIWECKNYEDLGPDDFRQVADYMGTEIGRFSIIAFRGDEIKSHYYEHIKRVADKTGGGIVVLLKTKDLNVFLRQAMAGKDRERHLSELYDTVVRKIS